MSMPMMIMMKTMMMMAMTVPVPTSHINEHGAADICDDAAAIYWEYFGPICMRTHGYQGRDRGMIPNDNRDRRRRNDDGRGAIATRINSMPMIASRARGIYISADEDANDDNDDDDNTMMI